MKRFSLISIALVTLAVPFLLNGSSPSGGSLPAAGRQRQVAPDFALRDLSGKTVRLSDLRGKVVVVNFWATWCPPCRHEIPWFIDLQKKYGPEGLQIVGIALESGGASEVQQFARRMGVNYTVLMGEADVASRYAVQALPSTYYVARDGTIVRFVPGLISPAEIEQIIISALEGGSNGKAAAKGGV